MAQNEEITLLSSYVQLQSARKRGNGMSVQWLRRQHETHPSVTKQGRFRIRDSSDVCGRWNVGLYKSPSGVYGDSPRRRSGHEVPQKLVIFLKITLHRCNLQERKTVFCQLSILPFLPTPRRLCFVVVCLSVGQQLCAKTPKHICMKFSGKVSNEPMNK